MQALRGLGPLFAITLASASAHAADDIGAAVRACRAETDDARRLECYDRAVDGARHSPPAPDAAAATATAEDSFGREHQVASEEVRRREQEARALGELTATVTAIDTRIDGRMTITLDNGQVWRQNGPDSRFRLKAGDSIRIQPGSMKSFILSGPSNRSTRVTRIR